MQLAAFVHKLAKINITNFNVRAKPNTVELIEQKLRSLRGFERFWYEVLCTADRFFANPYEASAQWQESMFICTTDLVEQYKKYAASSRQYETIQSIEISKGIKTWCPSAKKVQKKQGNEHKRGYQLPDIDMAREDFEILLGGEIDWDS